MKTALNRRNNGLAMNKQNRLLRQNCMMPSHNSLLLNHGPPTHCADQSQKEFTSLPTTIKNSQTISIIIKLILLAVKKKNLQTNGPYKHHFGLLNQHNFTWTKSSIYILGKNTLREQVPRITGDPIWQKWMYFQITLV